MSDAQTPRTDAESLNTDGQRGRSYVRLDFARQLERELVEAKAELEKAKQDRNEAAMRERNKYLPQLTAHKAALEKCEKALVATWSDLDHLNHWMPTPCRELYMEAKLEIAKLKGYQ